MTLTVTAKRHVQGFGCLGNDATDNAVVNHVDCLGGLLAPGFLDVQINGGFGVDFSISPADAQTTTQNLAVVAKGILQHGVTGFCPTLITSPVEVYRAFLPHAPRTPGGESGAANLGVHLEGPFISPLKKGAHPEKHIRSLEGATDVEQTLQDTYGSLENVALVTLAPEMPGGLAVIAPLVQAGVVVAVGHTTAKLAVVEQAFALGASMITHLFNAMAAFHHRDPGPVGMLASDSLTAAHPLFYGLIADNIHTHASALRMAYATHPLGCVLVTDAMAAMAWPHTHLSLGTMAVEIKSAPVPHAVLAGTDTLAGSIATMDACVREFAKLVGPAAALEAASLHPAQALGLAAHKGALDPGCDADLVLLDDALNVQATFIAGECVWRRSALCPAAPENRVAAV